MLVNVFGAFRAMGKPGQILMGHINRSALNGNGVQLGLSKSKSIERTEKGRKGYED